MSIPIIAYILLFITVCYFITFFIILIGFILQCSTETYVKNDDLRISIIIAARNEEGTIPKLLNDLKLQTYSSELFDIIVVDDHSSQKIASLTDVMNLHLQNLTVLELPDTVFGKKAALRLAAEKSTSELLIFTDADCRISRKWIHCFASKYYQTEPDLIIGMVDSPLQKGILKSFFRHEFISLIVSGIGSAALGFPTLCNGANLAVRRDDYLKSAEKMQTKSPSGDDVFLLHQMKKDQKKIVTLTDKDSVVIADAPQTLAEFFNQRARWSSKSLLYKDMATLYLALLVTITNLVFVICLIQLFQSGFSMVLAITAGLKIITDYSVIIAGLFFFSGKRSLIWLPLFQLLYPIYLIISISMGAFKIYRWKGRKY